jgi:hypothetical protein
VLLIKTVWIAVIAAASMAPLASAAHPCRAIHVSGFEQGESALQCDALRQSDTGIQLCAGPFVGSGVCTAEYPQGQDAHHGRDALAAAGLLGKVGAGDAGFDYTKISNSGEPLSSSAPLGSGVDDWACTRDNVTGLVWEIKRAESGHPRGVNHKYTWLNMQSPDGNLGSLGTNLTCGQTLGVLTPCNTETFVAAVNAAGLCGAHDWRLPTRTELLGIVNYGRRDPAIDSTYFPLSSPSNYWSSTPVPLMSEAFSVYFETGLSITHYKSSDYRVRLVRSAQ